MNEHAYLRAHGLHLIPLNVEIFRTLEVDPMDLDPSHLFVDYGWVDKEALETMLVFSSPSKLETMGH